MNVVEAVWEMISQARQLGITDYSAYCTRLLSSRPLPPSTGAPRTATGTIAAEAASASGGEQPESSNLQGKMNILPQNTS